MTNQQVAEILYAIAKGYSPITGDKITPDNLLAEPEVIAALEIAVNVLLQKKEQNIVNSSIAKVNTGILPNTEQFWEISLLFSIESVAVSAPSLANFLIGRMQNPKPALQNNPWYGSLQGKWNKKDLQAQLQWFIDLRKETKLLSEPWKSITLFDEVIFNKLSPKALEQLAQRVQLIPLQVKTNQNGENAKVSEHARHGQPWTDAEKDLLLKSLPYVNDLNLLSACFGRTNWSLKTMGQQLLYALNAK